VNKLRLTTRVLAGVTVLDVLFTPLVCGAQAALLQLATWPVVVFSVVALSARFVAQWFLVSGCLQPAQAILSRPGRSDAVTPDALRRADRLAQAAPHRLSLSLAVMWGLQPPALLLLHWVLAGPAGIPSGVATIVCLLCVTSAGGSYAVVHPLFTAWISDGTGQLYVIARTRGVELERQERTVAQRLVSLALLLCFTPVAFIASAGWASQCLSNYRGAVLQAQNATLRAARRLEADPSASLAPFVPREWVGDSSVFEFSPSGKLRSAGAALPAWATPASLRAAAAAPSGSSPQRATALYATALTDGRVLGAIVPATAADTLYAAMTVAIMAILLVWGLLAALLLSRSVSVPLRRAAEMARRAVEQGDLSQIGVLPVSRLDEVGIVTQNLDEVFSTMRSLAAAAGQVGKGNLNAELVGEGELPDAFRGMLASLKDAVQQMHVTSAELGSAAAEILSAAQEQEAAAASHSTGMIEVTKTMDSLAQSAVHVAESVQGVLDNAERTLGNTDKMVSRINELTGHANRIGDLLDVIREIADKTDLLALNGSLEATRAGDSGLGFSVVASEMRRLAERVTASVGDIKKLVSDIRESGTSTVVATEESKKLAEDTTRAARNITLVTQQQVSSTEQVTESARAVSEVIQQTASATAQTRASAQALTSQAARLSDIVRGFHLTL
jgi:methyl-accepting chemotaxis protein